MLADELMQKCVMHQPEQKPIVRHVPRGSEGSGAGVAIRDKTHLVDSIGYYLTVWPHLVMQEGLCKVVLYQHHQPLADDGFGKLRAHSHFPQRRRPILEQKVAYFLQEGAC